jgi:hypothetical protein
MEREKRSSKPQAASASQTGRYPLLDWMKAYGIALNRANYLRLNYWGNPPKELTQEEENELPPMFRRELH